MPETLTAASLDPLTQGWFNHGQQILALIEQRRPTVCVELGTWLGASAIPVARAIRRWRGTLTCIDTWLGEPNQPAGFTSLSSPWMLLSCARNLIAAGISANVRLIPATTLETARWWTDPIDYLYVDADHSFGSVHADLDAWVLHMKPGGLMVGDDYGNNMYPGVKPAWDQFAQVHGLALTTYQSDPPDPHGIQLVYCTV